MPTELIHHVGTYKQYTDEELIRGIEYVSKGLSEKSGKSINWSDRLKNRFDGGLWAPNRNSKRERYIEQKFGKD